MAGVRLKTAAGHGRSFFVRRRRRARSPDNCTHKETASPLILRDDKPYLALRTWFTNPASNGHRKCAAASRGWLTGQRESALTCRDATDGEMKAVVYDMISVGVMRCGRVILRAAYGLDGRGGQGGFAL